MQLELCKKLAIALYCIICIPAIAIAQNNGHWKIDGNSNTNVSDFIGTTDNTGFQLKTNSTTRLFVAADGKIGLGTTSPTQSLDLLTGSTRIRSLSGSGMRLLAVDSSGNLVDTQIGMRGGGGGGGCSPVVDGWGIENPTLDILRLCGSYRAVQIGNTGITNYGNLPNLLLDVHGDFRVSGDVGFNSLAGGTNLNVVFTDATGKFTLPPTIGMDPFWSTFGTVVTPGNGMFLGSRNNEDLIIKTNNATRLLVARTGEITASSLAGNGTEPVMVDGNGQMSRASGGNYWETVGNIVSNGQVLGSRNPEALKLVTAGQNRLIIGPTGDVTVNAAVQNGPNRMTISPTGEVGLNTAPMGTNVLTVWGHDDAGAAISARSHATSTNIYPYCIQAVVNTDNTKAFAVFNESITSANCGLGEDVFRVWGNGLVEAKRIKVFVNHWCDDVFEKGYALRPLDEVNAYIEANGHLPEVPSTAEVAQGGVDVGDMEALLLKKVEELTLYAIAQQQRCDLLEKQVLELNAKLEKK